MNDDIVQRMNEAIRAEVYRRFALVERACEAAIQGGTCGVWVSVEVGLFGGIIDAWPDERVPYGQKWIVPVGVTPSNEHTP
jgi:hypothetical protein